MFEAAGDRLGRPIRPRPRVRVSGAHAAAVRRWLAAHRWMRWLVVAVAGVIGASSQLAAIGASQAAESAWGTQVEVWVAAGDHDAGDVLRSHVRSVPVAVVPEGAVDVDPAGRVARQRVGAGEIVVEVDVTVGPGPASLAPPGSVVVAVADPLAPAAAVGATVMVATEGVVISDDAVVVGSADGVTQVAVPAVDAPTVALAAQQHAASLLFPAPDTAVADR